MRRHIPALSLLGSMILLPACASSPASQPAAEPPPVANTSASTKKVELLALQHARADVVAAAVSDLIQDAQSGTETDAPRALADARTNSVIVFGDAEQRGQIKELVARLDVPARPE